MAVRIGVGFGRFPFESMKTFRAWLDACKGGPKASSNFDYAGPLTELVLLGNVAVRTGEKLQWDHENLRATNSKQANEFIRPGNRAVTAIGPCLRVRRPSPAAPAPIAWRPRP